VKRIFLATNLLAWVLLGTLTQGAPISVIVKGVKVGELDVTNYTNTSNGTSAGLTIDGDFTTTNQAAGGQLILNTIAPLGLTYMQTVLFNTNLQQEIFRDANGNDLVGTFADPPYLGYTLRSGARPFSTDNRPWYSTIQPAGTPGAIPPNSFGAHQFEDVPSIGWADSNMLSGLANVLNGQNGSLNFETALVGVCVQPAANPAMNPDPAFAGAYMVCVLEDFTWGLNFTYVGPQGGRTAGTYIAADYTTALVGLAFSNNVTAAFRGAFDKAGNNAGVEWNVNLVQADTCPEPGTWYAVSIGLAILLTARSAQRYVRRRAA